MIGGLFGTQASQWGNIEWGLPVSPSEPEAYVSARLVINAVTAKDTSPLAIARSTGQVVVATEVE